MWNQKGVLMRTDELVHGEVETGRVWSCIQFGLSIRRLAVASVSRLLDRF